MTTMVAAQNTDISPSCLNCGAALPPAIDLLDRICSYCSTPLIDPHQQRLAAQERNRKAAVQVLLVLKLSALVGSLISLVGSVVSLVLAVGALAFLFGFVGLLAAFLG